MKTFNIQFDICPCGITDLVNVGLNYDIYNELTNNIPNYQIFTELLLELA